MSHLSPCQNHDEAVGASDGPLSKYQFFLTHLMLADDDANELIGGKRCLSLPLSQTQ